MLTNQNIIVPIEWKRFTFHMWYEFYTVVVHVPRAYLYSYI